MIENSYLLHFTATPNKPVFRNVHHPPFSAMATNKNVSNFLVIIQSNSEIGLLQGLCYKKGHHSWNRAFLGISFNPILYGFSEPPGEQVNRKKWLNAKSGHSKIFYESIDIFCELGHLRQQIFVRKTFFWRPTLKTHLIHIVLQINTQLF